MKTLRQLRKERNISMKELGLVVGVAESTISLYENGKRQPDNATLGKLADYFNVSVDYLLGREEIKNPPNVYDVDGIISYNVLGTVRAGFNGSLCEIPTGETIEIPCSMINGEEKDEYFVLQIKGSSMYPKLIDGDKILCKRQNDVDGGSLAVILYDGEDATVKKINFGNGYIDLIPINPEYETKRIQGADLAQCQILGKVVKLIRDL